LYWAGIGECGSELSSTAEQAGQGDRVHLIVLLKGLFASLADSSDPARRDLVFAVLADGLRPSR